MIPPDDRVDSMTDTDHIVPVSGNGLSPRRPPLDELPSDSASAARMHTSSQSAMHGMRALGEISVYHEACIVATLSSIHELCERTSANTVFAEEALAILGQEQQQYVAAMLLLSAKANRDILRLAMDDSTDTR